MSRKLIGDRSDRLARIGSSLRKARLAKALTQEDVAEALGTSRVRYNRIEQGIVEPKVGEIARLCMILDASMTILPENESIEISPRR